MKKKTMFVLSVLLTFLCTGCYRENASVPLYEAFIYDFSDAVENTDLQVEYQFAPMAQSDFTTPPESASIDFHGIILQGSYNYSYRQASYHPYMCHSYGRSGNRFFLDDTGNVVHFSLGVGTPISDPISIENAQKIAETFASEIIDLSIYRVSTYQLSVPSGIYGYNFVFTKYIDDFKTTEL